jgi:hypothetical protein
VAITTLPGVTRAQLIARTQRLAARLRTLPDHIPAELTEESLVSAHGLLGRIDDQIDTVILAARRRGE